MWGDGNTGAGEGTAAYSLSNIPARFGPATRHFGFANYAFADGHVKALKPRVVSSSAAPGAGFPTMVP
jgi:prepilin-type processing-associated H-X9-DG protein